MVFDLYVSGDTLNEEQKKMLSETGYYYMKGLVAGKRSVVQWVLPSAAKVSIQT